MTFRVNHQSSDNPRDVRTAWSCRQQDVRLTGSISTSITRPFAASLIIPCKVMRTSCCTFSVGGRVFIPLTRSPKMPSRNPHCSTMCDSCLVNSPRCPAQPLTHALPLSIKPYAMCSLMLLLRLPRGFRRSLGNVHQWALADHDWP
jgi:hypothetical protein